MCECVLSAYLHYSPSLGKLSDKRNSDRVYNVSYVDGVRSTDGEVEVAEIARRGPASGVHVCAIRSPAVQGRPSQCSRPSSYADGCALHPVVR